MIQRNKIVEFFDSDDYKYSVTVDSDFTYVKYYERTSDTKVMKETDAICLPTDYAVEIAKSILENIPGNNIC